MEQIKYFSKLKAWAPWLFYCFTALLLAMVLLVSNQTPDPDLWGRLSVAALYFQNGVFPYHDVFSFTAPHAPWYDHEWLTGFAFYQIMQWSGEPGLLTFRYFMLGLVFWLIFTLHKRCYKFSPLYAFYGLLALSSIYVLGYYATLRSQVFTFFFYMLSLWLLEHIRLGLLSRKNLLWLLPMAIIWGNLHGGFIVGVVLTGLYGIGEAFQNKRWQSSIPYFAIAIGMFGLVGLINPYGPAYLKFLIHAWTLNRQFISEWHSLPLNPVKFWEAKIMILVTLSLLTFHWLHRRKHGAFSIGQSIITPTLILLWMIAFTIKGVRFQTFLAFTLVAYLPLLLSGLLNGPARKFIRTYSNLFSQLIPIIIFLFAWGCLIYLGQYQPIFRVHIADEMTQGTGLTRYPLGAVRFLRQSPYKGNLLNRFALGEMLYWTLYPEFKISMDGRYEEVYTQQEFLDNFKFFDKVNKVNKSWALKHPDKIGADFILVERHFPHMKDFLAEKRIDKKSKWQKIYKDQYFTILARTSTLEKLPEYKNHPGKTFLTLQMQTIADYVTPQDIKRFKHSH